MKLGILAGGGDLPRQLAAYCQNHKIDFTILIPDGLVDTALYTGMPYQTFRLGAGAQLKRLMLQNKLTDMVLIGYLKRPTFWQLRPDLFTMTLLPQLGLATRGDDGLLRALINILEKYGRLKIRGIHEFMPELLAPLGVMGQHQPTDELQSIIDKGISEALALGEADIGQAVIVGPDGLYHTETRRGTDALIRAFADNPKPDSILVKLCKPQQELRIDLPTIGQRTVENAAAAGLRGIVVSAGKTLVDKMTDTIASADAKGLFLLGVNRP